MIIQHFIFESHSHIFSKIVSVYWSLCNHILENMYWLLFPEKRQSRTSSWACAGQVDGSGISWFLRGRLTLAWLCQHCNPPEVWPWLSALEIPLTRYFLSHFTEISSKLSKQNNLTHVTWVLKRPSGLPSVSACLKTHFILRAGIMWKAQSTSLEVFPQQLKPNRNNPSSLVCIFNLLITPQGPWDCSQAKKWEVTAYSFSASWKSPPFIPQFHWVARVSFSPSSFDNPWNRRDVLSSFPFSWLRHSCSLSSPFLK